MEDKFEIMGLSVMNFVFGRIKIYFLQEIMEVKKICSMVPVSE